MEKNEVIIDFLNMKGLKLIQRNDHFNFSIDSVLLANFATINRTVKNIIDFGTGNGAIPLILSRRSTSYITGIEIQPSSVELAQKNIILNNLSERIKIVHGDIKNCKNYFNPSSYDLVVSNPPFFKKEENEKQMKNNENILIARNEIHISLEDIIKNGAYLLKNRGYFAMVHRVQRLNEIISLMTKYSIEPKRIQFCHSSLDKPAKILLIEGIKGTKSNLVILPPLITHSNGEYSTKMKEFFSI